MATVKKSIAILLSLLLFSSMVFVIASADDVPVTTGDTSEATSTDATSTEAATPSEADTPDEESTPSEATTPSDSTPEEPDDEPDEPTPPQKDVPVDYDSIKDKKFTVKFDLNGAPGTAPSSISGNGGTSTTVPSATYEGHTFLGWSESADGANTIYAAGAKYIFVKNTTLYAIWEEKIPNDRDNFDLKFDANGGLNPPSAIRSHGKTRIPDETPNREKYEFGGWMDMSDYPAHPVYQPGSYYTLTKDTVLYAVWKSVNPTDGVQIHAVTETTVDYLSKVTIHATANRFIGHNDDLDVDEYDSLPEGYILVITDTDDEDRVVAKGNQDEVVFYVDEINRERHFAVSVIRDGAKIVDPERDSDGIELTMPVNIRVRDCLLDRLLAAVRKLFGLLPIVTIGPTESDFTTYYGPGIFMTIINKLSGISLPGASNN